MASNKNPGNQKIRVHIFVSGKVQGVYYRQNTQTVAKENGVIGWVRNLPDSRVEVVLEGDETSVNKVVEWCRTGPPAARVDSVEMAPDKFTGEFREFVISS